MKNISIFSLFLAGLIFMSCSNTKLISSYASPGAKIEKSNKILVIAMMSDNDKKLRANIESMMVQTLRSQGIDAGSSVTLFGPNAFASMGEKAVVQKLKDKNFDKTVTIALLDKTKENYYRPGYVGLTPYAYHFWGYYNYYYPMVYRPGYITDKNKFILEGNVYSLDTDKLLYSAQTKTINPDSPQQLASTFTKTLLSDMYKNGVFSN